MNNERRREIKKVIKRINELKTDIDMILMDEQFAYDNMPEGLQSSDRGQNCEDSIDVLERAMEGLDDVVDTLGEIN